MTRADERDEALATWLTAHIDGGDGAAPDPDLVVAYAEGRLTDEEADAIEDQLAQSEEGRALLATISEHVTATEQVRAPVRRASKGRVIAFALAAAAIVVLAIGVFGEKLKGEPDTPPASGTLIAKAFDGARAKSPELLADLAPLSSDELAAAGPSAQRGGITLWEPAFIVTPPLLLRWEPLAGGGVYTIKIEDESGTVVFEERTPDTAFRLEPTEFTPEPGAAYRWEVSAGGKSGSKGFRVIPTELRRRFKQARDIVRKAADVRVALLAQAHLAVRLDLWSEARLLAQAHVRNHPDDADGKKLLGRIERQLGMRTE